MILTERQQQILDFIREFQSRHGTSPSLREIAAHFGFSSMTAAADHVRALQKKGQLVSGARQARSLRVVSALPRQPIVDIPLLGAIPAGLADHREQEVRGCVSVDVQTLGFRPGPRTFALEVKGDSMVGRHIVEGDIVVLEHGKNPKAGDVVAALIDNESTLKTYVLEKGKPCLKAENPKYPKLIPAAELVVQGVMVALIRRKI